MFLVIQPGEVLLNLFLWVYFIGLILKDKKYLYSCIIRTDAAIDYHQEWRHIGRVAPFQYKYVFLLA